MNTTVLNVRVESKVKTEAAKVADTLGLTLSAIVNATLRNLVKSKSVSFSESYEPTPYLKRLIKEASKEYEDGKTIKCINSRDAKKYVSSLIRKK